MKKSQSIPNNENYTTGLAKPTITKSLPAIHFTIDPKTEMTLGAAKAFNAINYLMQMKTHASRLGPKAYSELLGEGSVTLSAKCSEFMSLLGCGSRNMAYLKKLVDEVGKMRYSWDNGLEGHNVDSGFVNMFTLGRVHNGEVVFTIPPDTRNLLITEKPVAVIDFLTLHANIDSKHGLSLNDLIQQEMFGLSDKTKVFTLRDSVLRNALNIKFKEVNGVIKYSYPKAADLKRKVIDVAVKDYNNADLEYKVVFWDYSKQNGEYFWTFKVEHHKEVQKKAVLSELSDEMLKITTSLSDFNVSEQKKAEIISSVNDEYDVQYLLYCIKQTKSAKPSNKAGYFLTIYGNNKAAFDDIWAVRKLELENERTAKAERHKAFIQQQKDEFAKQYKKAFANSIIDRYQNHREFPGNFGQQFKAYCKERGRTLNAHQMLDALEKSAEIDFASPVFLSFVSIWINENQQNELQEYVNSQTVVLPDA